MQEKRGWAQTHPNSPTPLLHLSLTRATLVKAVATSGRCTSPILSCGRFCFIPQNFHLRGIYSRRALIVLARLLCVCC